MTALRTHYTNISQHFDNADGTLTVEAIARRSGIMRYRSDSGDRYEFVPPELINKRDDQGRPVMGMLAGAPNTNEHPAQVIRYDGQSRKAVEVGKVSEEIHIYTDSDGERSVKVRFDVSDPQTIDDIKSGRKKGVSLGYLCNVVREDGEYRGQAYTHRQDMPFQIDHLAIVANPRNPGALITRFDSDDVAVMDAEPIRSPFEVIRVDACCAACEGDSEDEPDEPDEPKPKKNKKVKTDAEEATMIPVIFRNNTIPVSDSQLESLIDDGLVQPVRFDGQDYYLSMDVAINMHHDGLIVGGACGPGWEGSKGNCRRKKRSALKTAAGVALAGVAGGYLAHKISKNPKKAAALGAVALGAYGAGALLKNRAKGRNAGVLEDARAENARRIELDPPSRIGQNDRAARASRLASGTKRRNTSTYFSAGSGGKGAGSKSASMEIPIGTSVKEGRKGRSKKHKQSTGNPGISKYPWRNKK